MASLVYQNIFWFQVSIQNVVTVQELHSQDHFGKEQLRIAVLKALVLLQVVKELSART